MTESNAAETLEVSAPIESTPSVAASTQEAQPSSQNASTTMGTGNLNDAFSGVRKEATEKGYQKGYEKAMQELREQQQAGQQSQAPAVNQPVVPASNQPVMPAANGDIAQQVMQVFKQMQEEQQKRDQERQIQEYQEKLVTQLTPKLQEARSKYEDFDQVVTEQSMKGLEFIYELANIADNAGDIVYDLNKNPGKLAQVITLATLPDKSKVVSQIHAISQSLKNNEASQAKGSPRDPIRQVQPSNVSKDTGKPMTLDEAKSKYKF